MVIGIIGENCTGKSTLAEKIKAEIGAEIITGKDYLRMAKSESEARILFQEKLKTAVRFGADAVYFGGEMFSLRAGAGNFSVPEIEEAPAKDEAPAPKKPEPVKKAAPVKKASATQPPVKKAAPKKAAPAPKDGAPAAPKKAAPKKPAAPQEAPAKPKKQKKGPRVAASFSTPFTSCLSWHFSVPPIWVCSGSTAGSVTSKPLSPP